MYYHNGERTTIDLKLNETLAAAAATYFDNQTAGSLSNMLIQYLPFKKNLGDLFESIQFWSNLELK